jgi:hypothetical protein
MQQTDAQDIKTARTSIAIHKAYTPTNKNTWHSYPPFQTNKPTPCPLIPIPHSHTTIPIHTSIPPISITTATSISTTSDTICQICTTCTLSYRTSSLQSLAGNVRRRRRRAWQMVGVCCLEKKMMMAGRCVARRRLPSGRIRRGGEEDADWT